ncbi:hypothetical protein Aperf_G00000050509 [Anoplocephala perfoliata]
MNGGALHFLSVDLYKTLIYPKENVKTYAKFGQKYLNFNFDYHVLSNYYVDAFSAVEQKWPNFGRFDGISTTKCPPFNEEHVRSALSGEVTNEIYDWHASKDALDLMPGSVGGLTKLKDAGIKMTICSNSDERTPVLLKAFDLDQFFLFSLYSRSCDYMKPNPAIFELVCNRFAEITGDCRDLSSRMEEYGHVGDSESRDYWGARNAGCGRAFLLLLHTKTPTVWAYHEIPKKPSHSLVPTEDEICNLSIDRRSKKAQGVSVQRAITMAELGTRIGITVAIFLLCLLSERAKQETQPPAVIYMITSTGMSNRILPTASVILASIFYTHLAYLFVFEPGFGYPLWPRIRVALRLLALTGGSIRMLAAGDFELTRTSDKIGTGLSGCVCALMGLLSLPLVTLVHVSDSAHQQEMNSVFAFLGSFGGLIHWIIGLSFCLAFIAYSFLVLVITPQDRHSHRFSQG